jgi:hypothetical protein
VISMAKLSSQFYAAPWEIAAFVRQVVQRFELDVCLVRKAPFKLRRVSGPQGLSDEAIAAADWVVFSVGAMESGVENARSLELAYPDALTLEVGTLRDEGLRESWLRARTENAAAMKRWRQVARALASITYAGVVAVDPSTGVDGPPLGAMRCTAAARELNARGVRVLPGVGSTLLRLIDPRE